MLAVQNKKMKNKIIYKYRNIDDKICIKNKTNYEMVCELIETNNHWFSSVESFNDVFELKPEVGMGNYVKIVEGNNEKVRNLLNTNKNLSDDERISLLQKYSDGQRQITEKIKSVLQMMVCSHGISSFSLCSNSPVLWGVYAGNGHGIALEYETNVEAKCLIKVSYKKYRPTVTFDDIVDSITDSKSGLDLINKYFSSKSFHWKFEKEVRLISNIKDCLVNMNDRLKLKRIIIGPRHHDNHIKLATKYPFIEFVKSALSNSEYTIDS